MYKPPRDHQGRVIPYDEPLLQPEDGLIRHINPNAGVIYDENIGALRISSGAFSATSGDPLHGMSVNLEPSIVATGIVPADLVPQGWGAVRLSVGPVRTLGLKVGSDPIAPENPEGDSPNPHHGSVWGVKKSSQRSKLHEKATGWVVPLPNVAIRGAK